MYALGTSTQAKTAKGSEQCASIWRHRIGECFIARVENRAPIFINDVMRMGMVYPLIESQSKQINI